MLAKHRSRLQTWSCFLKFRPVCMYIWTWLSLDNQPLLQTLQNDLTEHNFLMHHAYLTYGRSNPGSHVASPGRSLFVPTDDAPSQVSSWHGQQLVFCTPTEKGSILYTAPGGERRIIVVAEGELGISRSPMSRCHACAPFNSSRIPPLSPISPEFPLLLHARGVLP